MTDTPSTILLLRLQSTGSNVNLWGGYLNTAMQMIEQASKGYQALAVTGDATISWTNYTTANTGECAFLKLTGTLAAGAALTFPSNQNMLVVKNAAGAAVTIKVSAGTGVVIPNGRTTWIACDGTDYVDITPSWLSTTTTLTNGNDIVSFTQLNAAIAAAGLPATAGTVLNSAADTTAGYLASKITGTGAVVVSTTSAGGNEKTNIAVGALGLTDGGLVASTFAPVGGSKYRVPTGGTVTLPTATGSGSAIGLTFFGAGVSFLSGVISSGGAILSSVAVDGDQTLIITDADSTRGWC